MNDALANLWKSLGLSKKVQLRIMRILQDEFLIGVTGIIFDDQNQVLLVAHSYRDGSRLSLPGGYIKTGEHPKEGLEREIKEETGLIVSADERMKIRTDRETARLDITYMGVLIGGQLKLSSEVKEVGFFAFDRLPQLRKGQLLFIDKALRTKVASKKTN
jgi:ADP-ribose pyrophosphatase YjhB (NUDIX family)